MKKMTYLLSTRRMSKGFLANISIKARDIALSEIVAFMLTICLTALNMFIHIRLLRLMLMESGRMMKRR